MYKYIYNNKNRNNIIIIIVIILLLLLTTENCVQMQLTHVSKIICMSNNSTSGSNMVTPLF